MSSCVLVSLRAFIRYRFGRITQTKEKIKTSIEIGTEDVGTTLRATDGMTLNNDLGASDAEIEDKANEGKASREVDPDTLDMLNN